MPSAAEQHPQVNPWIVAVAVMFATFMEVLDTTVVNVSLPHIAGSLSASVDEAAWALTSYLVANAIILPDDRLDRQLLRPQAHAARRRLRLHRRRLSLRPRAHAAHADLLPRHAGRHRRRAAAALAGRDAGGLPAAGSRQGDGLLGTRHRGRAHARPGDRRLAHRQLQLALGLLHQPSGGARVGDHDAPVHLRPALHPPRRIAASITGASACWRSASARCRWCSTRGRRTIGSPPTGSSSLAVVAVCALVALRGPRDLHAAIPWCTCASSRTAPTPPVSS